uniref:Protein E6 n=1 Tax=Human papillomavirus TaxID=10566 RepID=A0A385PIG2_9PAPI|nr:MAG: E6 protein [Human papillomavirus]
MADERPRTLEQYCAYFNTSFFDLHLSCIFCGCVLTTQDLASFSCKGLNLVLRNSKYFACCTICCCVSARFEFDKHCKCSVRALNIEAVSGKHLHELTVRCHNCLQLLDIAEKYDTLCRDDCFYFVRQQWKALCRKCVPK